MRNQALLDMVYFMMSHATLPTSIWVFALDIASSIFNLFPTKAADTTPYEIW